MENDGGSQYLEWHVLGYQTWLDFLSYRFTGIRFLGRQSPRQESFGNCLLVLDARSGKRIWHYQVVHHDLWDRDLPAAPNLIELNMDGKKVEAVAQITKSGHIFAFHRETGHPLFPIQEKPFPPSDLKGEKAWPTQPIPPSSLLLRGSLSTKRMSQNFHVKTIGT